MICRAEEARQLTRERTRASQQRQSLQYNATHRPARYSVGDLVWIWLPTRQLGKATKLLHRYAGPYKIIAQISDVTYRVELPQPLHDRRRTSTDIVHVSRMKPYHPPFTP